MPDERSKPVGPNPSGLCWCGCGKRTPLAMANNAPRQMVKGRPIRYINGHHAQKHPRPKPPNPSGLCKCGCGQRTTLAACTDWEYGYVRGEHLPYVRGHAKRKSPVDYIVDPDSGCWVWQLSRRGPRNWPYGQMTVNGRRALAHRVYYERLVGPIPEGLHLDHLCRNTLCVNPDHLEPVTCKENIRRGRGTWRSDYELLGMRMMVATTTLTRRAIADTFGTHHSYVAEVLEGRKRAWSSQPILWAASVG